MTRRTLFAAAGGAIVAGMQARAQSSKRIQTPTLNIGYEESGQGFPVILLHGFPDDAQTWEGVAPPLVKAGYRVLAPLLARVRADQLSRSESAAHGRAGSDRAGRDRFRGRAGTRSLCSFGLR